MGSEQRLTIEILRALHGVERELESALEPHGLSLAKLNVMSKLADAGEPLPLGTLADRCACVRSNITQLIDRLEADQLVARSNDPHDRRSVRAELTSEGRRLHRAGLEALDHAETLIVGRLPAGDRDAFIASLQSLQGES